MDLRVRCNARQKEVLDKIAALVDGFYKGNDNDVTYPLTGLLTELTGDYVDPRYIREKIELLEMAAR